MLYIQIIVLGMNIVKQIICLSIVLLCFTNKLEKERQREKEGGGRARKGERQTVKQTEISKN